MFERSHAGGSSAGPKIMKSDLRAGGGLGRRQFLEKSALLTGVLTAGSAIAMLAPSLVWALEAKNLDQHQADVVLALARALYPHKDLPDAVYALVVKDMDGFASDAQNRALVTAGVKALDGKAGGSFLTSTDARKHRVIESLIQNPLVQKVRGTCINTLYNNDMAFSHFGYEGEAFNKGGYIYRGFNDLTWLANPPADVSPTVVG
jgi:hypothetical protein